MNAICETAALVLLYKACTDEEAKKAAMRLVPDLRLFVGSDLLPEGLVRAERDPKEPQNYTLKAYNRDNNTLVDTRVVFCLRKDLLNYVNLFKASFDHLVYVKPEDDEGKPVE